MNSSIDNTDLQLVTDAPEETAPSEFIHGLLHLLHVAQYRRRTIVQALCVAAIIGAVYYAVAPRYYDSKAKLLIVRRDQDQMTNVADEASLDTTMATHRELIVSPVVIQSAIEQLLPEHRIDFANSPPSEWCKVLASGLSARTTRKANFIEVSYRSHSPEAAAAVVSAVVQSYLEFVDHTQKGAATEAIAALTQKSDELTAELTAKKNEMQALRDRVGSLAMSPQDAAIDPTIQRALKLNDALMDAQQHRLKIQASLASIKLAVQNHEDLQQHLVGLEEVVGREMLISALGLTPQDMMLIKDQEQKLFDAQAELQRVSSFYGPSHPNVAALKQQIQDIQAYLADYRSHTSDRLASFGSKDLGPMIQKMLEQSLAQADQQVRQLQVAFDQEKQNARAQSADLQHMQDIDRDITRLENEYDELISKITLVDTRQMQPPIQATVVEEPLPEDVPATPQLRLVAVLSLAGGLLVGGVIAFVQDVLEERFASPEEMSAQLGVPVLSIVRKLDELDGEGLAKVHAFSSPNAVEAEAFRTLRTALTLGSGPTDRIAVSSAEPGDGKTTVTANLAVSYAQAGKKTLVIDADLRKPGLTTLMGLKGKLGVADILTGRETISRIVPKLVHHSLQSGLDVLPAGLRRPNPAELLGASGFVELLAWAEAAYDQIIVDCPPVLAVSDAQIVGRLVDGAILVVQPQKNHRRLVARACYSFASTGTNVLGVVANGLSSQSGRGYGYGYGYGSGYGYGYGSGDEESTSSSVDEQPSSIRLMAA
ncbi:MAG TPA: polysaccharide biosynthesis tyrosine autokinase [Lacipirellulaceae bacterium]|nr:polysaccharide biosynthesis tyrosine autokinase [Lacipirellulaceae bacterium]